MSEVKHITVAEALEMAAREAAQDIYSLFKNASYFAARNAEHKAQMLDGWARLIVRRVRSEAVSFAAECATTDGWISVRDAEIPKDGRQYLAWSSGTGHWPRLAMWCDGLGGWYGLDSPQLGVPTHWRPLPSPPAKEQK